MGDGIPNNSKYDIFVNSLIRFCVNNSINLRLLTAHIMHAQLYLQHGDRIVTIHSVTSVHPMTRPIASTRTWSISASAHPPHVLRPYHYNELLISSRNHNRPRHYSTALPQQRPVDSALVKTLPLVAVLLTFLCSSIGFFTRARYMTMTCVRLRRPMSVCLTSVFYRTSCERIELVLAWKFSSANPTLCFQEIRPK